MWYKKTILWEGLRFAKRSAFYSLAYGKKLMMFLSIRYSPKHAYLFSYMKRLPFPRQRVQKTENPLDDFIITEDPRSSKMVFEEKVNIVMRGSSFKQKELKKLTGKTFLVNWPEKIDNLNAVYATGDQGDLLAMIGKGMTPLLLVHGMNSEGKVYPLIPEVEKYIIDGTVKMVNVYHSASAGMSSGLGVIVVLTKFVHQMDIYGFDQYQEKDLGAMSYWEAMFALQQFSYGGPQAALLPSILPPVNDIPERAICSWHYVHRFNAIPWIRNHGFLANISKHKGLTYSLDQVFYQ